MKIEHGILTKDFAEPAMLAGVDADAIIKKLQEVLADSTRFKTPFER